MTYTRTTLAPLSVVVLAVVLTACTPLPDAPVLIPAPSQRAPSPAPVSTPAPAPALPAVPITVYVPTPGETVYVDAPGETAYVDVPGPVQVVTDQGAIDGAYASGYATAEDQMNAYYANLEDDAYNRGFERGGATENQGYSAALSTPCATEDSSNCYWLATDQGNGLGHSFVDIAGVTYYLN